MINTMKEKETTAKSKDLDEILTDVFVDLKNQNEKAYTILIEETKQGFFKQHQTTGTLKKIAERLLNTIKDNQDEN